MGKESMVRICFSGLFITFEGIVLMRMTDTNRRQLYAQLAWDYHISAEALENVIQGVEETAGHYRQTDVFRKVLESYPWFTVLQLFAPGQVLALLTDDMIQSLRTPTLQQQYAFIRKRLSEVLPVAG